MRRVFKNAWKLLREACRVVYPNQITLLRSIMCLLAIVSALCVLTPPMSAKTPNQNLLRMNGGYVPAYYCNYALGSFCGGESYSTTSLRTIVDATGAVTYAPNNLLLNSNNVSSWSGSNSQASATGAIITYTGPGYWYSSNFIYPYMASILVSAIISSPTLTSIAIRDTNNGGSSQAFTINTTPARYYFVFTSPASGSPQIGFDNRTSHGASGNAGSITVNDVVVSAVTYETTPRPGDQVVTTSAVYYGPAFDYTFGSSPTPLGLRIWQAAENYALYSRDMTQSSAWTLGATMTAAKTATGIDGVANSATLLTAGLTSATDTVVQAITLTSASDTYEVWIKGVTLTGAVNLSLDNGTANYVAATSSNCSLNGVGTAPNTSQYVKCVLGPTTLTNPSIRIQIANSGDAINVDGAQLENVGVAGPPIFTAATAVATAADVPLAQNALSSCLASSSGSLVIKTQDGQASRAGTLMSANGSVMLGETSGNAATTAVGINLTSSNTATWVSPNDIGLSWGMARGLIDLNATKTTDTNTRSPAASFYEGSTGGLSAFYDGHIRSVSCYSKFLPGPQ